MIKINPTEINNLASFLNSEIEANLENQKQLLMNKRSIEENITVKRNQLISLESQMCKVENMFMASTDDYEQQITVLKENINDMFNELDSINNKIEESIIRINNFKTIVNEILSKYKSHEVNKVSRGEFGLSILETQEFERKRIASDLHDSTVQILTNLAHKSELCTKIIDLDITRTKLELSSMIETIHTAIKDMRNIIYNLRPMSIDDLGLVSTIEKYSQTVMLNSSVKIYFHINNEEVKVLPVVNLTLFRIIQEACTNAIKHSNSNVIRISLSYNKDDISLIISDEGIGFDYEEYCNREIENEKHFGLSIMKERACLLAGEFRVESNDSGTSIMVNVPMSVYVEEKNE